MQSSNGARGVWGQRDGTGPRTRAGAGMFARSIARALVLLVAGVSLCASLSARAADPAPPALQAVVEALGAVSEALFAHVRDTIRPTLNQRALQSPVDVQQSGQGNAAERARLLGALLAAAGHPVRFQRGELDDAAASLLVHSALPPLAQPGRWPAEVPLSDPATSPRLLDGVRWHTWVQVLVDGRWTDLDPAFPGALPGKRNALPQATFYRFSAARLPRLARTVEFDRSEAPGEFEALLWWDGLFEALSGESLALRVYPYITQGGQGEQALDPARRLVDPLAGADEDAAPVRPVTVWRAELLVGDRVLARADLPAVGPGDTGGLRSLRLRSRVVFDEGQEEGEPDAIEDIRLLAEADAAGRLPLFQRHSLLYSGGAAAPGALTSWLASQPADPRSQVHAQLAQIQRDVAAGRGVSGEALETALGSEQALGGFSGHLLNLAYATMADALPADLARRLGVQAWFDEPRLIISSVLTMTDGKQQLMLDLRRDRMTAVALQGQPLRIVEPFQFGRGVMTSALEGRLLSLATGTPALTTAVLMRLAREQGIPVRLISSREAAALDTLQVPEAVLQHMQSALEAGQVLMLPLRPVASSAGPRWGWWQIEPQSRHTVGVFDSGLHQAVVERTLIESEGVLSDEMAAVIGAISGATDAQFVISAMVLKHGELTAEAVAEAKAYLSDLGEALCQALTVEAKVGGYETLASASVEMEGCFRYEVSAEVGAEAGGSLTVIDEGWCEAFQRGFTCSALTILNAYQSAR